MNRNNTEIERKFFVAKLPENLDSYAVKTIKQAYICTNPTMRLRKQNNDYFFTFKSGGIIKKTEFEHKLTKEQFEYLWKNKTEGIQIEKKRYIIPIQNGLTAELDIYEGELAGFMNVEVEFGSIEDAEVFIPPDWFGKDISADTRYSNASLSICGLPK